MGPCIEACLRGLMLTKRSRYAPIPFPCYLIRAAFFYCTQIFRYSFNIFRENYSIYMTRLFKVIYLYIVRCSDGSLYTGVTSNLDRRLLEHNLGLNSESYTFNRRPVKLVFHEMYQNFNLAFEWETRIKKWSKAKKEALIAGDFELLKILAKKKFKNKNKKRRIE